MTSIDNLPKLEGIVRTYSQDEMTDTSHTQPSQLYTQRSNFNRMTTFDKNTTNYETSGNNNQKHKDSEGSSHFISNSMDNDKPTNRRRSAMYSSIKNKKLLVPIKDLNKKENVLTTPEAISINPTLKLMKWKINVTLSETINALHKELNEIKTQIEITKNENEQQNKLIQKRKAFLQEQLTKEEQKEFDVHYKYNIELKRKKEELLTQIESIEVRNKQKQQVVNEKFQEMLMKRQLLKKEIDELNKLKEEIVSQKEHTINNSKGDVNNESKSSGFGTEMDVVPNVVDNVEMKFITKQNTCVNLLGGINGEEINESFISERGFQRNGDNKTKHKYMIKNINNYFKKVGNNEK